MTLENIIEKFDEKFNSDAQFCSCYEGDMDGIFPETIKEIHTFLRSSYSELLRGVIKEIHDLYTPIHQGLPTVFKDEVISIIKSKLPKEDSIN